jgi:hypothetical protein
MGLVRENLYLYDVQLVWLMHMRITIVLVKLVFFVMSKVSKWNRAELKFCEKLKKTATETFEMLKNAYGEECLLRTSVSEWRRRFKEGREMLQDERKGHPSTSRTEDRRKSFKNVWPKIKL